MLLNSNPNIELLHGDCLDLMPLIPDKSIDMILADLPYGTTACKWDVIIPFEPLWKQYKRIIKDNGAIVLTASQPFTSALVMSNIDWFKYEWIWDKKIITGFLNAKIQPLRQHENIVIFYNKSCTYNPQMHSDKLPRDFTGNSIRPHSINYGAQKDYISTVPPDISYPRSIINQVGVVNNSKQKVEHPTQKPVKLFEYLIRTYTNEGKTVLDNVAGSGTTAIACYNTNRNAILMEKDLKYFEVAKKRIENHVKQLRIEC